MEDTIVDSSTAPWLPWKYIWLFHTQIVVLLLSNSYHLSTD